MTETAYLVITIFLALLGAYALYIASRALKRAEEVERSLTKKINEIEHDLSAVMDGAFGMGDHLEEVKKDLKDTIDKQMQLEQSDLGNLPYNQAVRMVGQGASVDDLVGGCGLSRSEAELVELLHKKSPPVMTPEMVPAEAGTAEAKLFDETPDEAALEQILDNFDIDTLSTDKARKPEMQDDTFSSIEKAHSRGE